MSHLFGVRQVTSVLAALALTLSVAAADRSVFIAERMLAPSGQILENQAVLVEDGRIVRVTDADGLQNELATVIRIAGVLSPGLVEMMSDLGVRGDAIDRLGSINPDIAVVDAFDAAADDVAIARRHGVTAAMIAPWPNNLVGGTAALVRFSDTGPRAVVVEQAGLCVTLAPTAYGSSREPTSRAGALRLLREVLQGSGETTAPTLKAALAGELTLLVTCGEPTDALQALSLFGRQRLTPVLALHGDVRLLAETMEREGNASVILGPFSFSSPPEEILSAASLEAAGVIVAFAGGTRSGEPESLRITAALAVEHGMSPAGARRAITGESARMAGGRGQVGAIVAGAHADFVVFSDDPLRLDARVESVWLSGSQMYRRPGAPFSLDDVTGATDEE